MVTKNIHSRLSDITEQALCYNEVCSAWAWMATYCSALKRRWKNWSIFLFLSLCWMALPQIDFVSSVCRATTWLGHSLFLLLMSQWQSCYATLTCCQCYDVGVCPERWLIAHSLSIYSGNFCQAMLSFEPEWLLQCAGHIPTSHLINLMLSLINSCCTHFYFSSMLCVCDFLMLLHFHTVRHLSFPYQTVIKKNWKFVCLSGHVISVSFSHAVLVFFNLVHSV